MALPGFPSPPSVIGLCDSPTNGAISFSEIVFTYTLSGTETKGTAPNRTFNTYSLENGADNFTVSIRRAYFVGTPGGLTLPNDKFAIIQSSCCCQCNWGYYINDPDGVAGHTETEFNRANRVKRVIVFENGSPTQTVFYDSGPFSTNNVVGQICNRYPDGTEPPNVGPALTSGTLTVGAPYLLETYVSGDDFTNPGASSGAWTNQSGVVLFAPPFPTWTNGSTLRKLRAATEMSMLVDTFLIGQGKTVTRTVTTSSVGDDTVTSAVIPGFDQKIGYRFPVPMKPCKTDQEYKVTDGYAATDFSLTSAFTWRVH